MVVVVHAATPSAKAKPGMVAPVAPLVLLVLVVERGVVEVLVRVVELLVTPGSSTSATVIGIVIVAHRSSSVVVVVGVIVEVASPVESRLASSSKVLPCCWGVRRTLVSSSAVVRGTEGAVVVVARPSTHAHGVAAAAVRGIQVCSPGLFGKGLLALHHFT